MGGGESKYVVPPAGEVIRRLKPRGGGSGGSGGDGGGGGGAATTLEARTSVLVWNMQKEQNSGWAAAFERLARGRGLLVLQELHLRDEATEAALVGAGGSGGLECVMATQFVYARDGTPTGVAVVAAAAPVACEAQVTPDVEPVVGTPKASLIVEYRLPTGGDGSGAGGGGGGGGDGASGGATVLVVTVHGINRAPVEAFERQIDAIVARLRRHAGAILLAGDFNTQSARKLAYLHDAAAGLGLSAVSFDPDGRTVSKLSRRPLDHAFVRGAVVERAATATAADVGGSDHVALTFDLVWRIDGSGRGGDGKA